jgi:hypothetical protein
MHERAAGLPPELLEPLEHLCWVPGREVDLGAVTPRRSDLRLAGRPPHHEERVDSLEGGAVRERLCVVPCRGGDHAAAPLVLGKPAQRVEDAARLERARPLEELGLQVHARTERGGAERRRPVQPSGDRLSGRQDVVASDHTQEAIRRGTGSARSAAAAIGGGTAARFLCRAPRQRRPASSGRRKS